MLHKEALTNERRFSIHRIKKLLLANSHVINKKWLIIITFFWRKFRIFMIINCENRCRISNLVMYFRLNEIKGSLIVYLLYKEQAYPV